MEAELKALGDLSWESLVHFLLLNCFSLFSLIFVVVSVDLSRHFLELFWQMSLYFSAWRLVLPLFWTQLFVLFTQYWVTPPKGRILKLSSLLFGRLHS